MERTEQNKLLSSCQHGFVPKRSCATNLLHTLEKWTTALDTGRPVDAVYLDFAKAFDSVPHQRLIANGIKSKVLNWIRISSLEDSKGYR